MGKRKSIAPDPLLASSKRAKASSPSVPSRLNTIQALFARQSSFQSSQTNVPALSPLVCPICGSSLPGSTASEQNQHVNQCLDAGVPASNSKEEVDKPGYGLENSATAVITSACDNDIFIEGRASVVSLKGTSDAHTPVAVGHGIVSGAPGQDAENDSCTDRVDDAGPDTPLIVSRRTSIESVYEDSTEAAASAITANATKQESRSRCSHSEPERISRTVEPVAGQQELGCSDALDMETPAGWVEDDDWGEGELSWEKVDSLSAVGSRTIVQMPPWQQPQIAARDPAKKGWRPTRKTEMPSYKRMPGTPFTVDAFCFGPISGCEAYFLSHWHSDHYGGLTSAFEAGPVYCSAITGNLVAVELGVREEYIVRLPMETPVSIHGIVVTLVEANHCPGAVLFLFELPSGKRFLHTGDFRASPSHISHVYLRTLYIDRLYLDTTYCAPQHRFPPQDAVTRSVSELCFRLRAGEDLPSIVSRQQNDATGPVNTLKKWFLSTSKTPQSLKYAHPLILCGAYNIGKERMFMAIAKRLGSTIFCTARRRRMLASYSDPDLNALLSDDPKVALVHVVKMSELKVEDALRYVAKMGLLPDVVVCIRPTGWVFQSAKQPSAGLTLNDDPPYELHHIKPRETTIALPTEGGRPRSCRVISLGVPYSEHSSFNELQRFCAGVGVGIGRVIPTVNEGKAEVHQWCRDWVNQRVQ
ncbi:hypothetical protein HKX48_006809, partial [Thoreauomyces humboldtii]